EEFSYVTEHVGHDGAIGALLELSRAVALLPGVADGPWAAIVGWLSERIADVWRLRGPYPGLGSALQAAGLERGALIAHRLLDSIPEGADPWPTIDEAITQGGASAVADLVGRVARRSWERLRNDPERYRLLRL